MIIHLGSTIIAARVLVLSANDSLLLARIISHLNLPVFHSIDQLDCLAARVDRIIVCACVVATIRSPISRDERNTNSADFHGVDSLVRLLLSFSSIRFLQSGVKIQLRTTRSRNLLIVEGT